MLECSLNSVAVPGRVSIEECSLNSKRTTHTFDVVFLEYYH